MRNLNLHPKTEEQAQRTVDAVHEIERLVFGEALDDDLAAEAIGEVAKFAAGYPSAPSNAVVDDDAAQAYSLEWDINYIILAIRNQSGIDLSYRCKHYHWWEFLLEFNTLCGDHYILRLMEARSYKGKDKDMLKRRAACALPPEYTAEELAEYDEFSAMFEPKNDGGNENDQD